MRGGGLVGKYFLLVTNKKWVGIGSGVWMVGVELMICPC